jgi:hypothetical protein
LAEEDWSEIRIKEMLYVHITQKRKTIKGLAELLAIVFMGAVALAAQTTGFMLLLFPELAALSHDIMTRPRGKWASQPLRLVLTPTLTAVVGIFFARRLAFGVLGITLIVALSLIIIKLMKSTIAAAISAGVLPMALSERSWRYPLAIFVDCTVLVLLFLLWKHYIVPKDEAYQSEIKDLKVIEPLEAISHDRFWGVGLIVFVIALGIAAQATCLRFLLFPPLIVMAYELLGHPQVPEWMRRPALFPIVCLLTASVGLLAHHFIHANSIAVMLTFLCSVGILRLFDLHMPPALAVGLLPFVIKVPDYRFPLSVLLGTISLGLYFSGYKRSLKFHTSGRAVLEETQ